MHPTEELRRMRCGEIKYWPVVGGKRNNTRKDRPGPPQYERNAFLCSIYSSHADTRLVRFMNDIDIICVFTMTGLYH